MENFILDNIKPKDINGILKIYNSNVVFLKNHLGAENVSKEFVINEISEMKRMGFNTSLIRNFKGELIGLCDYKIGDDVYLSLLMIDGRLKGKGIGKALYYYLEKLFRSEDIKLIKIDVVYDYKENVIGFWRKLGFRSIENIELIWNGHKSKAIRMQKNIS